MFVWITVIPSGEVQTLEELVWIPPVNFFMPYFFCPKDTVHKDYIWKHITEIIKQGVVFYFSFLVWDVQLCCGVIEPSRYVYVCCCLCLCYIIHILMLITHEISPCRPIWEGLRVCLHVKQDLVELVQVNVHCHDIMVNGYRVFPDKYQIKDTFVLGIKAVSGHICWTCLACLFCPETLFALNLCKHVVGSDFLCIHVVLED